MAKPIWQIINVRKQDKTKANLEKLARMLGVSVAEAAAVAAREAIEKRAAAKAVQS